MKRTYFYITCVFVFFLVSGCKSKQVLTEGERATSTEHLIELVKQSQPTFINMNANSVSAEINMNGEKKTMSASVRMITDSVIVLAVYPFLGIEMGSVELYPDKWILYDKMNRLYVTENYQYFFLRWGQSINFNMLQSIFSANFFSVEEEGKSNKNNYSYLPLQGGKNEIVFEDSFLRQKTRTSAQHTIESVIVEDKKDDSLLTIQYENYEMNKGVYFPKKIKMNLTTDETKIILNLTIQKVSFNTELKLSLTRPDRYTRTTLDHIF